MDGLENFEDLQLNSIQELIIINELYFKEKKDNTAKPKIIFDIFIDKLYIFEIFWHI